MVDKYKNKVNKMVNIREGRGKGKKGVERRGEKEGEEGKRRRQKEEERREREVCVYVRAYVCVHV